MALGGTQSSNLIFTVAPTRGFAYDTGACSLTACVHNRRAVPALCLTQLLQNLEGDAVCATGLRSEKDDK